MYFHGKFRTLGNSGANQPSTFLKYFGSETRIKGENPITETSANLQYKFIFKHTNFINVTTQCYKNEVAERNWEVT